MSKTADTDPRDPPQPADDGMNFQPTESERTQASGSLKLVESAVDSHLADSAWKVSCADCGALTQASGNYCIHCGTALEADP